MTEANGSGQQAGIRPGLRTDLVARLIRPNSAAIVGISAKPGAPSLNTLNLLKSGAHKIDIHLVGRSGGEIDGQPVLTSVEDLPEGVDLAVLALPASGVNKAIEGCIARNVGAAAIFASGFAELGEEARAEQARISAAAEGAGLGLLGPNCLGFTNYVDGVNVGFLPSPPAPAIDPSRLPGVAIVTQSGGLLGHLFQALDARRVTMAHRISTGNEAGLGLSDFIAYMADDPAVNLIAIYVEQVRRPAAFLEAVDRARKAGKHVVMMHTGRSQRGQTAAASHTGAMAGDYQLMATLVQRGGVILTETVEEWVDCTELLTRYPVAPVAAPAVITTSGALCSIAHDTTEDLGLTLPSISQPGLGVLTERMPDYMPPGNPFDVGTLSGWDPTLISDAAKILLEDPAMGSLIVAIAVGPGDSSLPWAIPLIALARSQDKPVILAVLGEEFALPEPLETAAREGGLIITRSPERAFRTIARVTNYGRELARPRGEQASGAVADLPALRPGPQPEWLGKSVIRAIGIATPEGTLVTSADEAAATAAKIGYPVVLKIQAAELTHKTEIGGVILNLADEDALRAAYATLEERAAKVGGVKLDGMLIEKMSGKGLELVIGAKRDPQWGPVILAGLGGIFVEALKDVRLLPPDLTREDVIAELRKLKSARLLDSFRGAPAPDVGAVADAIVALGRLMQERPEIAEVDINPLVALPEGQGVRALDALIVTNA